MSTVKLSRSSFDIEDSRTPLNYDLKPFLNIESISSIEDRPEIFESNLSLRTFSQSSDYSLKNITTEDLLTKCKSGAQTALDEFFKRYRKFIIFVDRDSFKSMS